MKHYDIVPPMSIACVVIGTGTFHAPIAHSAFVGEL